MLPDPRACPHGSDLAEPLESTIREEAGAKDWQELIVQALRKTFQDLQTRNLHDDRPLLRGSPRQASPTAGEPRPAWPKKSSAPGVAAFSFLAQDP
jgi:hypothetical protein